jgi:hypothetical protein
VGKRASHARTATAVLFSLAVVAAISGASLQPANAATPTSSYRQNVLGDSPAGYWRLGETGGTTAADELGRNPGTYTNVTLNQAGTLACDTNPSASFDGTSSYVRVGPSSSLDMTSAGTVEFWAKRRTVSGTYQVLVGKPGNGQSKFENYAVWLNTGNRYQAYFGNGTTVVTVSTTPVTDTNWHYVVATDDGSTVKIYLDGVLKASTTTTLALTPNNFPLNLGRANGGPYYFNGWLDEVAIYPTALSAAVVQGHYAKALSDLVPPCFSLTAPANGATLTDSSVTFAGSAGSAAGDSATVTVNVYSGESATGTPTQTLSATRQADNSYSVSTALADGVWTAQAQQSNAGTTAYSAANTFNVDAMGPPLPTIDSGPADPTSSANASFSFSDSQGGVTFRCSLDDGAFTDCTSPQSYSGLTDGSHRFRVKAVDSAGNEGAPASYTWTIDTTPPVVTLTSPAPTDSRNVWPTFTGTGGTASGDSPTIAVNVYAGPSASGTPLQTVFATRGATGGAFTVTASAPLNPGTYTARAQQTDSLGNAGSSTANTFTVGDPVVLAAGSIASCSDNGASRTRNLLAAFPDAMVLTLGNAADDDGSTSDYQNCYDPQWGFALPRTRPVPGSHDLTRGGSPPGVGYTTYFANQLAPLGPTASDLTRLYYSYDIGAWHIVALNDLCDDSSTPTPGCDEAAQEQWLRSDLAAHTNQCVLALSNRPRWSSDSLSGNRVKSAAFWDLFYQYGVDLVLNGATHHYERFAPQDPDGTLDQTYGVREIISGHGGAFSISEGTPQPNSVVYDDTSYGVLKLTLHDSGYDWQFLPIADGITPAGGSFTDSGTDTCHGPPPVSSLPYRDQVLAAAPASYWRLGETAGTTASDEVNANSGTYNNVTLNQPGALTTDTNPSASFNGTSSYVRVPSASSLNMTSAVTVEFWAKRRSISNNYQVVVGKPGDGQTRFENYAVWLTPSNRYTAYFGNGTTSVAVQTPVGVTDTNWHYIAVTNDGATAKIYQDGVLKQISTMTLSLTANNNPLNIGRANGNNYFFNGWLDEVAVYPTALTATTIQAHYNRAIGP